MTSGLGVVRFVSWPNRLSNAAAIVVGAFLSLGVTVDSPFEPLGFVGLVAGLGLAVRAARMGVWMAGTRVVVRNVLRTHEIDIEEVGQFEFEPNPIAAYRNESMVLVSTSGRRLMITGFTLPVFASMQGPGRARCITMNRELETRRQRLPETPDRGGGG